jgi:CHAT domain-containing protein/Tol biopolymer transport system component
MYFARSADGKWLAAIERGSNGDELWLHPGTVSLELPRLLRESPVRLAAPTFNSSGTLLAYVDYRDDVKGDIWLLDLTQPGKEPRRLTGKVGADDTPVFTPDGKGLVYQRQLPGSDQRQLVRIDLDSTRGEILPLGMDAAFAVPSPDGTRWVLVSRKYDSNGDLWLWESKSGTLRKLTSGPELDLYPAWDTNGTLLFSRFTSDEGSKAAFARIGQVFRMYLDRPGPDGLPEVFPLTAGTLAAVAPVPAGDSILFLSGQGGGGQVLKLPASGEFPDRTDLAAQWQLARLVMERQPPDPPYALLACYRVLAREQAPSREGAQATLALAGLLEKGGDPLHADRLYAAMAGRYAAFPREVALAQVAHLRVQGAMKCEEVVAGRRQQQLYATRELLLKAAAGKGDEVTARALIDAARLFADYATGAEDLLAAVALCEQVSGLTGAGRPLQAEAALRRALLLAKLERGEGALESLVEVARRYSDQEEWAEAAIAAILDQVAPRESADRLGLAALAERYRESLPRLAMGAWNRIGDLAYRGNEWAKAKDAYRTVLEKFPQLSTPTAAARFALAEVLYREERYAEATALYEKEMVDQPEDSPLYQLARAAYIRKTVAAGENLYRLGEIASARSVFLDLIRYDGRSIEAHRGYIKSVAAQGQAAELLELYRRQLANWPDDPVLLYATGLCLTYLPGRDHLAEADRLLVRSAERMPESEFPPQTRGYVAEITETVHGEQGGLERALDLYRRAWLLNNPVDHPENRANLDLNIGNVAYLLGRNATAWQHYHARMTSGIPFDNYETELLFLRRYGAVAFQVREQEEAIVGYSKALQLADRGVEPSRTLDVFGKLSRRVTERLFTGTTRSQAAEKALTEQQAITAALEHLGEIPVEAPPSPGWDRYDRELRQLLERERLLLDSASSWNSSASGKHGVELMAMLAAVTKELDKVPRLVETSAELHDRLALAALEAERFSLAREHFDAAFRLNKGLGNNSNLVANRRSASVAAYRQAGTVAGEERRKLLVQSRDGFREVLTLLPIYPPNAKSGAGKGGGLINVGKEIALDKGGATAAAFGFSAEQEQRLAETFLARVAAEMGDPATAARMLRAQLERYPDDPERLAPRDLYGVGLLSHRTAHLDYAVGDRRGAMAGFRQATRLSLKGANPVSAMLNLVNWGQLLLQEDGREVEGFLGVEAQVTALARSFRATLPRPAIIRYHNDIGVVLAGLAMSLPEDGSRQALLYAALRHLDRSVELAGSESKREGGRFSRQVRIAALFNRGLLLEDLGLDGFAQSTMATALMEARSAQNFSIEWRALARLGRYDEALKQLDQLPPTSYDLQRGEIMMLFAPRLAQLARKDAESAFALLEKLSELERIQLLGRSVLGLDDPAVVRLLGAAAPHLAETDRLQALLGKAPEAEREYLLLRVQQEQALIDSLLGKTLEQLPPFYQQGGVGVLRLAAAAVALQEAGQVETVDENGRKPLQQRLLEVQGVFVRECVSGKGGRLCNLLLPQPAEVVDVVERLEGKTLLRFTPLDSHNWLLFTVGGKSVVKAETLDSKTLEARLSITPPVLAAFEEPGRFSTAPVLTWGVSATQLLRTVEKRRPFRRQVLDLSGWWPESTAFVKLPGEQWLERLPDAHTLVIPGRAGMLIEVPVRPGAGATGQIQWEDASGVRRLVTELVAGENIALAVAPRAGVNQAYYLGQMLSLLGVPTLLLSDNGAGNSKQFVDAYATTGVAAARRQLPSGWLQIGDWGPDLQEAARLGKSLFMDYGKKGVLAHNAQQYSRALAFFENALTIARENPDLAKQRSPLHRYARESAYAAGNLEKAIFHADALVKGLAKEKPFSADHGDALLRLGLLQGRGEHFAAATEALKEGIGIFSDLGLAKEQASALADFGVVMENAVDYPKARALFEEAAGLRRTLKDDLSLADQYRNLGRIHDLRLNQYALAEQFYGKAQEIYGKNGNAVLEAESLLERGRCQRLMGNFPAADALYRQALDKVGDKNLRSRMRVVLEQSNNAWYQGRYQEAFDLREQVQQSAEREKWPLEQVMARNTGGLIWWTLGDNKRALLELRAALERAEQLEVRRDEVATTLNNIGLVLRESGDYKEALLQLEQALAIDRKLGSRWAMAYDLRNMGQTRLKMGNAPEALKLLSEAATLAGAIGDKVNLAKILLARGDAELQLKQHDAAAASYGEALTLAEAMLLREVAWRAHYGLARLQQVNGKFEVAVASLRKAIETVEGLRAEIRLDQLKDGFLADKMDVYVALVGLLVDQGRNDEAFAIAERSRARNLIDILGRQRLSLSGSVDQELYDRQNRLKEQIQEQELLSVQATSPTAKGMYSQALERLRAGYQDLLIEIERRKPELLSLVKVEPVSLEQVRAFIEPGVALLSYYQLPDRLLCWRIERDRAELFTINVAAADLAARISSYRRMVQNLEPLEKQSAELYNQLLGRPLAGVGQLRAIGIVPHGSLHYLAFATLTDGRDYLIDRYPLFHLPAASVLRFTITRRQTQKNLHILAVGNPDLGNPSLDLPFAEREAGTLRWNYPDVTTLTRERATESWVREHISEFGIIHLASHGEFDPVNPLFSAVRLTKDVKADGKLQADEVFGLDIRADLVVLSACQTGLGEIRGGDDVVGMNRAFLFAGTHALMSSLWRVSDVATAILMKQFYRDYTRNGKADSLRKAMLHVKNRYPHPGYWGAFVLTGDYQ